MIFFLANSMAMASAEFDRLKGWNEVYELNKFQGERRCATVDTLKNRRSTPMGMKSIRTQLQEGIFATEPKMKIVDIWSVMQTVLYRFACKRKRN